MVCFLVLFYFLPRSSGLGFRRLLVSDREGRNGITSAASEHFILAQTLVQSTNQDTEQISLPKLHFLLNVFNNEAFRENIFFDSFGTVFCILVSYVLAHDGTGENSGHVRVFSRSNDDSGDWNQIGNDLSCSKEFSEFSELWLSCGGVS